MNARIIRCGLSLFVIVGVVVIPWTQQESTTLSFCGMATKREIMERVKQQVQNALQLYEKQNIPALQQQLYELYLNFNQKGGGKFITDYPAKEQLAECFTMMLRFDWMNDNEIREVWAENGFYCIIKYLNKQNNSPIDAAVGALNLFIRLCVAREDLKPKVSQVLNKAVMLGNPIFKDMYIHNSADYLLDQFMYLAARMLQPLMIVHKNILIPEYKRIFDNTLQNKAIEKNNKPDAIIAKASFIAQIIGSILEDM